MRLDNAASEALEYLLGEVKIIDSVGNGTKCECCSKHVPKPLRFYHVKQYILCPTAYDNVCLYLEISTLYGEDGPPGSIRKHFGDYIQNIATNLIAHNLIHSIMDSEAII